jgi:hypothetical protein
MIDAGERDLPSHKVVQGRPKCINVAAMVRLLGVHGLFIGHVVGRAEALAGNRQMARVISAFGEAKIG